MKRPAPGRSPTPAVHLLDLPDSVHLLILHQLDPIERLSLSQANSHFRDLILDERLYVTVDPTYHEPEKPSTSDAISLAHHHRRRSSLRTSILPPMLHRDRPEFSGRRYATLEEAVLHSRPGDTIRLVEGVHQIKRTIVIKHPLRILGMGEDGRDREEPALLLGGKKLSPLFDFQSTAVLEGVCVKSKDGTVLLHRRGSLRVSRCTLHCRSEHLEHLWSPLTTTACTNLIDLYSVLIRRGRKVQYDKKAGAGLLTLADTRLVGGDALEHGLCAGTGYLKDVRAAYDDSGRFLWLTVDSADPVLGRDVESGFEEIGFALDQSEPSDEPAGEEARPRPTALLHELHGLAG